MERNITWQRVVLVLGKALLVALVTLLAEEQSGGALTDLLPGAGQALGADLLHPVSRV